MFPLEVDELTNEYQTAQLRELDALHHLHPFTDHSSLRADGARVIVRGDGPYIWDSEGNRILDGMAGLWTCSVGYGRKELAEAAYKQMLELPYYNTFFKTTHPAVVLLSRKLAEIAPDNLNQVFYGDPPDPSLLGAQRSAQAPHHHLAQERLSWLDDRRRLDGRYGPCACPHLSPL